MNPASRRPGFSQNVNFLMQTLVFPECQLSYANSVYDLGEDSELSIGG